MCLFAVVLVMFGCSGDEPISPAETTSDISQPGDHGTFARGGMTCPDELAIAIIATGGYSAIQNWDTCEDDLYYEYVNDDVAICRLTVQWDTQGTTYRWDDARNSGWSSCYHYGTFFPADAVFIYESAQRVIAAMDDPNIYYRCVLAAKNPLTGEEFYTIAYDDPDDPSGSTVRRTLTLQITPNTTCN
jgi:hypothetical protein